MAKNNTAIKEANLEESYTAEQIDEIEKCINDPLYFIKNYVYVQHPDPKKGSVLFELYPYQEDIINNLVKNRHNILKIGRQQGKTLIFQTLIRKNGKFVKVGSLLQLSLKEKTINFLELIKIKLSLYLCY